MDMVVYYDGFLKYDGYPFTSSSRHGKVLINRAESPVGTVPLGTYPNGRPYGLCFVGRYSEDHKVLKIMQLYESTFPPRRVPQKLRWRRLNNFLPPKLRHYV